MTETYQFNTRIHTTDYNRKGEPIKAKEQHQQQEQSDSSAIIRAEMMKHSSHTDSIEERFRKAKEAAGLI